MWPSNEIPKVSADLLIQANDAVGAAPNNDPSIAIIKALSNRYQAGEVYAACVRLMALTKLIKPRGAKQWILEVRGQKYALIDRALFQAASQASLRATRDTPMTNIAFDPDELLNLALGAAGVEGSA
jgi:hypothetical protein